MKNLLKKATAMMLALVLLLGLMTAPVHADTPLFTIESEDAQAHPGSSSGYFNLWATQARILRGRICLDAELWHINLHSNCPGNRHVRDLHTIYAGASVQMAGHKI